MNIRISGLLAIGLIASASVAVAIDHPTPGVSPGSGAMYATDAYPGFDDEKEILSPERKSRNWFDFIIFKSAKCDTPAEQLAYCVQLMKDGSYSKAAEQLNELVKKWPASVEAPKAQQALAELWLSRLDDCEEAFAEYRYLLDFYSSQCDYDAVADKLYKVAGMMRLEGKEVMFVRFANTTDVRRAYEACVLHAPGAKWVPEAMLIIGALREDEGKFSEAIKVYENLRNIHPESEEAKDAFVRESEVRMKVLRELEYNRMRCKDTLDFLKQAVKNCRPSAAQTINGFIAEAEAMLEADAYKSAKFYDSRTRTKRSAICAYEDYLKAYPMGIHADEIRARLQQLKGEEAK